VVYSVGSRSPSGQQLKHTRSITTARADARVNFLVWELVSWDHVDFPQIPWPNRCAECALQVDPPNKRVKPRERLLPVSLYPLDFDTPMWELLDPSFQPAPEEPEQA